MFGKKKDNKPEWPKDEDGKPIPPVLLAHIHGGPLDMELTLNLLTAYNMPHIVQYPNNGSFGKLILGHSPMGTEIFVPETLLSDAQDLLNAEIVDDEGEAE